MWRIFYFANHNFVTVAVPVLGKTFSQDRSLALCTTSPTMRDFQRMQCLEGFPSSFWYPSHNSHIQTSWISYLGILTDEISFLCVFFYIDCVCIHTCAGTCYNSHVCGGQRTTWRNQFFCSTMWILGLKLRPSIWQQNTLSHWAILPAQNKCSLKSCLEGFKEMSEPPSQTLPPYFCCSFWFLPLCFWKGPPN